MSKSRHSLAYGLFWAYAERICAQVISLVVSIILARILSTSEYGIVSIVMIFISICDAFVTGGFGNALVQKKDADDLDFSTILICSVGMSFILYTILFFAAPFIANFYNMDILEPVVRILGLRIPITGINTIQQARIQRTLEFKKFFFATLIGTVISAFAGFYLASNGYGVWALVAQYLTNSVIDTIVLYRADRWKCRLAFSILRAKKLLRFGGKLLLSTLICTINSNVTELLIGKAFGASDLAYYDQAKRFPNLIVVNINTTLSKVLLPVFSSNQNNRESIKQQCRKAIQMDSYVLSPLLVGLFSVAETLVIVVYTEKWESCIPYLRILSIALLIRPVGTICSQTVLAIGKSGSVLQTNMINNIVCFVLTIIGIFIVKDLKFIAYSMIVTELLFLLTYAYYTYKYINYSLMEIISDLLPGFGLSAAMGIFVYFFKLLPFNQIIVLLIQVTCGGTFYVAASHFLKIEPYTYISQIIKKYLYNFRR